MKKWLFIFTVFISVYSYGQNKYDNLSKSQIEYLRSEFLSDAIKFKKSDIIWTESGNTIKFKKTGIIQTESEKRNINSYSKLVVVNSKYLFLLDIMDTESLIEFINEVLVESKIKKLAVIDKETASALNFNGDAKNGIVAIHLKKEKLSPKILALSTNLYLTEQEPIKCCLPKAYCLVIDKCLIQLDSLNAISIKPEWIKKIVNMKDEKYIIYGDGGGEGICIFTLKKDTNCQNI